MTPQDKARALRPIIEEAARSLNDETALNAVELFPLWNDDGANYEVGDRVQYDGVLYKCLQTHQSMPEWAPDVAVALFAEVLPGQDGTDIGVWVQPDSTNAYMIGDKVHFPTMDDPIYESIVDNNVWAPDVYGWELVEE